RPVGHRLVLAGGLSFAVLERGRGAVGDFLPRLESVASDRFRARGEHAQTWGKRREDGKQTGRWGHDRLLTEEPRMASCDCIQSWMGRRRSGRECGGAPPPLLFVRFAFLSRCSTSVSRSSTTHPWPRNAICGGCADRISPSTKVRLIINPF